MSYTIIYRFSQSSNGEAQPYGRLVAVKGTLYGTTYTGGAYGYGTVYTINGQVEKTLYSFRGDGADGANPLAGLINVNGTFYGTTFYSGASGHGVVFSITTKGVETVLHSSTGGANDGPGPQAGLTNVNGTLFGTTRYGGQGACSYSTIGQFGCGTVYSISTTGAEHVLHSFSGPDGRYPDSGVIALAGTLYGTTGGGGGTSGYHYGTVFALTPSGSAPQMGKVAAPIAPRRRTCT